MKGLWRDFTYAVRQLAKNPGFAAIAILTLALGIGANTAIFTVVNSFLLKPLALPDPGSMVQIWETTSKRQGTASMSDLKDWQAQNSVFTGIAGYSRSDFNLSREGSPERVSGVAVTANYFDVMRASPQLGRAFSRDEDTAGHEREVVLSDRLWKRLGASPTISGQSLLVNGESYSVIGVMPAQFNFPSATVEMWVPLVPDPKFVAERGNRNYFVVARLRPGISLAAGTTQMKAIAARLEKQYPDTNAGRSVKLVPLQEQLTGSVRQSLWVLLAAVAFVFLIACANVVNLLLTRTTSRGREIAIRRALGAGMGVLLRQFLMEGLLLSVAGGLAGWLVADWGLQLLVAGRANLPTFTQVNPDMRVFGFTLILMLITALALGVAMAWKASHVNVQDVLKKGGRSSTVGPGRQRTSKILVITEVASTVILLTGAGLMLQTFVHLRRENLGVDSPEKILTMRLSLPAAKYTEPRQVAAAFLAPVMERIEGLPGVRSAGAVSFLPIQESWVNGGFEIEGQPSAPPDSSEGPIAELRAVSNDFYRAMGIPLQRGRYFTPQDGADSGFVTIINTAAANRYWPNQDPMDQRIHIAESQAWYTIVGVVQNTLQAGPGVAAQAEVDVPFAQWPASWPPEIARTFSIAVRTGGDAAALSLAVRQEILRIDPDQPVSRVKTMEQVISDASANNQFDAYFLGLFAAVAMVLAAIGIYGVLSYGVRQRTHEIGIRMALGARPSDVLVRVIGEGLTLAAIGLAAGITCSLYLTRFLSSLLFGVKPIDFATFFLVSLVITAVVVLACLLPARRAMTVDPLVALRYE
ncbi:MAG TPA: ABC transporter permease [Candidatus Acidoferrales bacterium]|nr:ABC transporter permease [Candidatus Acidoferrales bacterium]